MNCLSAALILIQMSIQTDSNFSIDFFSLSTLVLIAFVSTSFEQTCTILNVIKHRLFDVL